MRSMRVLLCLGLCVPLAACAGANAAHQMAASEPANAAPSAGAHGRLAQASAKKRVEKKEEQKDEWWQEGGVTREKINAMCWMKIENAGRRDMAAEKRADLVNACVEQTLKEHPLR
jgi:hypothetical protein